MRTGAFLLSIFFGVIYASATAMAAERKLSASEIQVFLSGNTAVSTGSGASYKQFFDPDGATLYLPEGGREDRGKWRADPAKQQYCSWWERGGWSCYDMFETEDGIIWRSPGGRDYPARLLEGNRL